MSGKYTLIEVTRLTDLETRVRELEAHIETLVTDKDVIAAEFNDARWKIEEHYQGQIEKLQAELGVWENREKFWDDTNKALSAQLARCREMYKRDA